MAKDGTNRGGVRIGAGKKRKSLEEKILDGDANELQLADSQEKVAFSTEPPKTKDYLSAIQRNGEKLCADEIYKEIWKWIKSRNCENLIDNHLLEQYAMCVARWQQCENEVSRLGLKSKHPTTGGAMASIYVRMAQDYLKQINQLRYQIYSVVKDNSLPFGYSAVDNDPMEKILQTTKLKML